MRVYTIAYGSEANGAASCAGIAAASGGKGY